MKKSGMQNIILSGFMATGKTTVGKILARETGRHFVDTDELITKKANLSIPEIFSKLGEAAFRNMETDIAEEIAGKTGLVVSTGGKFMLDQTNADLLCGSGVAFSLIATPKEILRRVGKRGIAKRPLLSGGDPETIITKLLEERRAGYARFKEISTDGKTPKEVAEAILIEMQETA